MWIINNSLDVIRVLEEKQLSLNHVSTWDFSTLYTSLPHAQLKKQLHDLLICSLSTLNCFEYNGLILSEKFIVVSHSLAQTEKESKSIWFQNLKPNKNKTLNIDC